MTISQSDHLIYLWGHSQPVLEPFDNRSTHLEFFRQNSALALKQDLVAMNAASDAPAFCL